MAAWPGEENVMTLFGDIHYFYAPSSPVPRHHRFDKGSYVYLFEDASARKCRIEIANAPGTEEQDAFFGFLDQTRIEYSYNHHCMVSLTVADSVHESEWHLPTYDPRNETKCHCKLYSLDIYFWMQQDALQFVKGVRRVLPPFQVEVSDEPAPPPKSADMSSVVQRLEKAAISGMSHASGAPPAPWQGATGSVSTVNAPIESAATVSPPPPQPLPQGNYAPMSYNPAAPAAPEAVRHREKTPPPDDDPLNPLAVACDYQKQPFTPGIPPHSQPAGPWLASPGLPPPPQQAAMARAATMPVHPGPAGSYGPSVSHFAGSPGPASGTAPVPLSASMGIMPSVRGEYSGHTSAQPSQQWQARPDYSIHQQVYRPTETEAGATPHQYQPKQDPQGRLQENAGRFERGVTGMLKKFEKFG